MFFENANSSVGTPAGVIIKTDEAQWGYFPDRHMHLSLMVLQAICLKISELNDHSLKHLQNHGNTEGA